MGLFDQPEEQIRPPSFPLTARLNQAITDYYFQNFVQKYLPGYEVRVTSTLREEAHNAAVDGAENSAHLHGLAVDFQIFKNGARVPQAEEIRLFDQVIKPNWPGYALDEIKAKNHIHVNLTRRISISTGITTAAVMGFVAVPIFKRLFTPATPAKGRKR